jgi:hypothetical protein
MKIVDWDFTVLALLCSVSGLHMSTVDQSNSSKDYILFLTYFKLCGGARSSVVVKALGCKPEGRRFEN